MEKILNFLFPRDIIRLKLSKDFYNDFKIVEEDLFFRVDSIETINFKFIAIVKLLLLENSNCSFSTTSITSSLYIESSCMYFLVIKFDHLNALVGKKYEVVDFSIEDTKRGDFIGKIVNNYCHDICQLSKKKFCLGDENCNYYNSGNYDIKSKYPILGDRISYTDKYGVESCGIVTSLFYCRDINMKSAIKYGGHANYEGSNSSENFSFVCDDSTTRVDVLERNSLSIIFNPCKLCVLSSCESCELLILKNLNIINK